MDERKNEYVLKKRINDDLFWVGGTDRRLALFENAYPTRGEYPITFTLLDEKTVPFDTVTGQSRSSFLRT